MARILVAFYNCMKDDENPNAMPVFYESFVQGLRITAISLLFYGLNRLSITIMNGNCHVFT